MFICSGLERSRQDRIPRTGSSQERGHGPLVHATFSGVLQEDGQAQDHQDSFAHQRLAQGRRGEVQGELIPLTSVGDLISHRSVPSRKMMQGLLSSLNYSLLTL